MSLSFAKLKTFRTESDDIADILVRDLQKTLPPKELWALYSDVMENLDEIHYEDFPDSMKDFFTENQKLPDWLDSDKVKLAEDLFLRVGPIYSACLLFRALPVTYIAPKSVKVLTSTGYLSKDAKQGTAKRLLETSQFIFNVMEKDTFTPDSTGLKHILKVRFLHAMIRCHLQDHKWDIDAFDLPINQEDMAGTILTFSVGAMKGLKEVNVNLTTEEKDALSHYWAIVGDIIGVDEKLLPKDYKSAEKLYDDILNHQAGPSDDGTLLTSSLCNFIRGFMPMKYLNHFPEYIIDYLINNESYSKILGLYKPKGFKDKLFFSSIIRLVKLLNGYTDNKLISGARDKVNGVFSKKIVQYFDEEFNLKLNIPVKIKHAWGL